MFTAADATYIGLALNPVGGIYMAVPYATLSLHYPSWLTFVSAVLLGYVPVIAVDGLWNLLMRVELWKRLIQRRASERVERLVGGQGSFWATFLATPLLGAWLVMAVMRYARVPQRRVAAPILFALSCISITLITLYTYAPSVVGRAFEAAGGS